MNAVTLDHSQTPQTKSQAARKGLLASLALCVVCLLLNILGVLLAGALRTPLYLDNVGTILAGVLGGPLPGIVVGYLSNIINSLGNPATAYYASVTVLIAMLAAYFGKRDCFRRFPHILLPIFTMTLVGGGIGSLLTWALDGHNSMTGFLTQLSADMRVDLLDKAVVCVAAAVILRFIPQAVKDKVYLRSWQQAPLSNDDLKTVKQRHSRAASLQTKIVIIVGAAILLIAFGATLVSGIMYHRSTIEEHTKLGQGVANLAASVIDPDRVGDYMIGGDASASYRQVEKLLYSIRDSSPDIEYVYAYQILPDGCHVVFDLDTEDLPGAEPGEIVPFDESFTELLPDLLAGKPIDPIITDDTYGWLLTVYKPVYDEIGNCRCYVAADISMGQLTVNDIHFMVRIAALFVGFFLLVLVLVLWLAEYSLVIPINSMSMAAGAFAYTSEKAREHSVQRLQDLNICTGDELENLYLALSKTTGDTMQYITDVQEKSATINKMQNGLILVLADMVESRDQCTGDHVRKTAAYSRVILEQMRKEGLHSDILTDEYIEDVVNSAPLHDVGKIQVSDTLLNKPGKLTDEEFARMQYHTTAGGDIISHAIALVSDTGYLAEAKNLATYHPERWDGKGYPTGLKGEEIHLSARIMAVADVFDALVSRRSYKAPFPFEKAMDIIREEAGTHFDPDVAAAFLHAEDEVRRVSEMYFEE